MKTYLDMDEILRHRRRYVGQEYDEPYLVSAVPEEVIRSLPPADVVEVKHGRWHDVYMSSASSFVGTCSICGISNDIPPVPLAKYCPNCGAKMDGGKNDD